MILVINYICYIGSFVGVAVTGECERFSSGSGADGAGAGTGQDDDEGSFNAGNCFV